MLRRVKCLYTFATSFIIHKNILNQGYWVVLFLYYIIYIINQGYLGNILFKG